MTSKWYQFLTALLLFSSVSLVSAQSPDESDQTEQGWSIGGYYENLSFDSEAAYEEGIGDSADVIGLMGEYEFGVASLAVGMGLGFVDYDDEAEFRQLVEEDRLFGDDDVRLETSDASALNYYLEFGPNYQFGEAQFFELSIKAGYSGMIASERTIEYCSNCREEDIDINGGVYGLLGASFNVNSVNFGLQYRQFASGDIDNGVKVFGQYRF